MALISKEIRDNWTVLDVGCGRTSALKGFKRRCYKVGIDIYPPYIEIDKELSIHNSYVIGDARALPFKSKSFDVVMCTELLEHLEKSEGRQVLQELERVAKHKLILTTPNGFLPTYAGPDDNPAEIHKCGYTVREFTDLGFTVYGYHGLKVLWKVKQGQAVMRFAPRLLTRIMDMSELLVYHFPQIAFQLLVVKRVGE